MFELDVAMRHVRSRRRQTFFSIFAVALSVGIIIISMSLFSGYMSILIDATVENQPHITVLPKENEDFIHLYRGLEKFIYEQEGVVAASSYFQGEAALQYRHNVEGAALYGINPEDENKVVNKADDMVEGNFSSLLNPGSNMILGFKLARKLNVNMGDTVTAQVPGSPPTDFTVTGIFQTGTPADESVVYAGLERVQDFYGAGDVVTGIGVRVSDVYSAEELSGLIEKETNYETTSWVDQNADILNLLAQSEGMVYFFYIIIFAISGFGIANILIMIVMEKVGEIGMLMAMGTTRRSIMVIFLMEAGILGLAGVIIGTVIGYISVLIIASYTIPIPPEMYFGMDHLPVLIVPENFVIAGIFALVINTLAGLFPARRASKMDPVEAIHNV